MTGALKFEGEMAHIQRSLSQCHDLVARRTIVIEALHPVRSEKILEVGCGGGFYAFEVAQCVGSSGRVCAVDISPDQINASRELCAAFDWVECKTMDVLELQYADGSFDAVYSHQVIEYVAAVDDALEQIARVLKPGGRLIIFATNWSSIVWHSQNQERMRRVLAAWDQHAPHANLPVTLVSRLRTAGIQPLRQQPVPILNNTYHQNCYSYWIARLMRHFVVGQGLVEQPEADAWLSEFDELDKQGAYFFCYAPIMTEAIKIT